MPADSESTDPGLPTLPHTYRPLGPRIVAVVLVVGLGVVCAMAWIGFDEATKAAFDVFQKITMAFFALMILACVHALTRSRVSATKEKLIVVNGYRRRELAWAQVVAVRLPPGAPWARLDLADGSEISAMGIQGSDGNRAAAAVRDLRRLVAELG
ncbi:PH domain-containing protein [Nocardioides sp. CER19]|uniref:PH domain-containing protein n=1 Tax=Nocardioides sp. CER19 TaxID=3038538 RepID=UPI0024489C33|nr:PH domain-containing protein [Nocardioides sp. CER19]MDH2416376.1 PH domain-containing protein [Nocardioides sp. CER19]